MRENVLYRVPLQLGWSAPENEDCVVRDNVIIDSELIIKDFKRVTREGNLVFNRKSNWPPPSLCLCLFHPSRIAS